MHVKCSLTELRFTAPYIPYGDEVDLLDAGDEIHNYHSFDKSGDISSEDQDPDSDPAQLDGFEFTWDRWASPETPLLDAFPATPYSEEFVHESRDGQNKARSVFRNPSVYFARDSRNATKTSDFLDLCYSTSQLSLNNSTHPRRLRKRRQSQHNLQSSSALTARKSMMSMLSEIGARKIKEKKSTISGKHKSGCESGVSCGTLDLPNGITQTGRGIGFTPAHHSASRSHVSLASVAPRSCIKGLSALLGFRRSKPPPLPKSRDEVMQQIYGSTWSVHEAQMSTVTFGIPDGLGPRRDSVDELGRKSS